MKVSAVYNYGGDCPYTDLSVYIEPGDGSEWHFVVSLAHDTLEITDSPPLRAPTLRGDFAVPDRPVPPEVAVAWAAKRPEVIAELEQKKAELQAEIDDLCHRSGQS